jgi:hypothetical protein
VKREDRQRKIRESSKELDDPAGRHGKRSTMVTSQLPVDVWHEVIGKQTIADANLARIVHDAYRLELSPRYSDL